MSYLVLLYLGAFVFFGSFIWDSIFDRTFRRAPSDWLGYSYLTVMAMVLGYGSKYLDEIRAHPYRSSIIAVIGLVPIAWFTVMLWRKAAKWDEAFHNRQNIHPQGR